MNSSFSFNRFGVMSRINSAAVRCVHRRIHGDDLIAHGELVAVGFDEVAHVVALERDREPGERPRHRVTRREGGGVVVHRDRFVVPRDHHHVVVRFALHRALLAQEVEIRVRVLEERVAEEEVDRDSKSLTARLP